MAPSSLSLVLLAAAYAAANDVQYITDLNLYSLLAPCAQSALSQNVQNQISSCGEGVTELQSCVCTKGNNYADISTAISSSLSYSCDSTATEDFTSANVVYSAYCTPDKTFDLPTPTANIVSEMITDMPLFSSLAPCAQSGLSIAVGRMSDKCPEAENQYAPCICTRNENSAAISDVIKSSVSYNCENTHDITSAQAFFAAYCAMNDGTTALPAPSPPPGDMSYYITALDAYSSLDGCAQSALSSIVEYQTYNYCPQGPQALASCVCIKGGRFSSVSSSVTSEVKWDCSSTRQLDNVRSAMDVLDFYCDAAKGNVVATVTESTPFFFSSFTVAILASKAVHLIAHFSTVPFSAFIIYLPTFLIYDLLAVFVLRLLLQNSRGGFWLIPVSIGSLISFIAVGGAASQLGFFAQTSGELQWRDAQAYANKEGLEVLLSGSAALLAFTGAIYAVGFVLRNILHNAVGNVLQSFGEDVLSILRWLSKFRSAQLRRSRAEKRDAHPLNKDRDEEGAASAEMLLHNGTARISEDHSDVSTLLDESFPEKGYEYDQPEPSRRRRRLPAWIGLFFFAVYLTIAYITRPARPYDYMSITLPISMLDVFQNHADYCTLQNSIYDNPWPFPDLLAEDHWEKPGANSKGWAPGSDSKLAQEYRERTPQWLPEELPRGFFRWDPLRFKNGFLGSHKPKGPGQTPSCPNVPLEPPFYNPVNDPLKITNLDNDILEPLRKPLEDGSIKIKNVVLVLMESLRQEFWPMKQGSEPWKNIMESHEGESKAAKDKINQILSQMAPHIEQISGVSGGFKDSAGKEFPKAKKHWTDSSAKGFGGVNVVGSYTAASMSTKSFGSVHCGAWPMPVDKFDEADTDSYQPCIPQVLDLFNKAKVDDEAPSDDFRDQEWMPALFEAEVEEYDRQEIFDQKIGFKHIVTRKQIEESPRFNSSNILNQKVNYFAYPEPVLKPHISEFVRSARAKDKRIWMSHFTSTTHHAWDTPSDFSTLDYLPSKGSNAWHTDFNKYLNTLRYHDKWMGELMQLFDDLDMTNETLIVFIGDHGQTFKEDYRKTGTYEVPHVSDFRVPITFRHPHLPRVQSAVNATSISVLPTILDLLVSSGSLNKRDTEMASDLAQDYEGQSLVREYKKKDGKRRAWNFSVINSGAGMLTVTSADVPYKLNMPLEKVFEYMVSNLAEDPTERKAVTAWTYDEMVASVGKKMGNDAKVWAEEAVAVGKWWAKERKRLWRYRTLPFYPGTSGLKGHGPPGFGPPGFGPPGHGPPGHRPPGRGPPPPHPY